MSSFNPRYGSSSFNFLNALQLPGDLCFSLPSELVKANVTINEQGIVYHAYFRNRQICIPAEKIAEFLRDSLNIWRILNIVGSGSSSQSRSKEGRTCTGEREYNLELQVKNDCDKKFNCDGLIAGDQKSANCDGFTERISNGLACKATREQMNNECWGGVWGDHLQAYQDVIKSLKACSDKYSRAIDRGLCLGYDQIPPEYWQRGDVLINKSIELVQ